MSPDKTLHKIQLQINELVPKLELFVEHTVQPSSGECEQLMAQLNALQENLVIYRYLRQHNEISPALDMHAKISEAVAIKEIATETIIHQAPQPPAPEPTSVPDSPASSQPDPVAEVAKQNAPQPSAIAVKATEVPTASGASGKTMSIGINDKFRFINTLFAQNTTEYTIAVEQLNTVGTWADAEIYLNSLRSLYGWKEDSDIARLFYAVVKKRFA